MANPNAPAAVVRRRDKRRNLSSSAIDVRDPFEIISLAIRFDESRQDESLLLTPLESAHLYDHHLFTQSLEFLQKKTAMPSRLSPRKKTGRNSSSNSDTSDLPPDVLTPIILSGLLNAIQEQRQESQQEGEPKEDISSKLVQYCQAMRRVALNRVRTRKKRHRIQRVILPLGSLLVLFGLYLVSISDMRSLLQDLGYVESCDAMGVYEEPCRLAEAALWSKYRDYLFTLGNPCQGVDCDHSLLEGRYIESPFTMHTSLIQDLITLDELDHGRRRTKERPKKKGNLQWLGESTVNRLVREAVDKYLTASKERRILDVGSGVAGTLYALFPTNMKGKFSYHGISVSAAETHLARQLVLHHSLDLEDIKLEQKSFDETLPTKAYTAVIAIESLAYSRDIRKTLENLIRSLLEGGVLIAVDDIAYLEAQGQDTLVATGRGPHAESSVWTSVMESNGCKVQVVRDLSLEYEVVYMPVNSGWDIFPELGAPWEGWMGKVTNSSRRIQQLQQDRKLLHQVQTKRQEGYDQAELGYFIFVCQKS